MVQYLRKRGASVGENCFIVPTDLDLEIEPGRLKIGDHVAIAAGVRFLKEREACPPSIDGTLSSGEIVIEDNCFIGLRSIIYPNVRIGPNSVVGAGSVVWSDVPPDSVVMGVPARPFGSLERYREKCFHSWFEQRPPGVVIEPGATWWNTRHFALNHELLRRHLLKRFHKELS
jgi:tetrahydrodipicolinate N-succinyltransferase